MQLKYLQEINDIFFINKRIKAINPYYKIFYNTKKSQYEVHDLSNLHDTFCISFNHYPNIKIIKRLNESKKENIINLLKSIENENLSLETLHNNNILNTSKDKLKEVLSFAEKSTTSLSRKQINKIIS